MEDHLDDTRTQRVASLIGVNCVFVEKRWPIRAGISPAAYTRTCGARFSTPRVWGVKITKTAISPSWIARLSRGLGTVFWYPFTMESYLSRVISLGFAVAMSRIHFNPPFPLRLGTFVSLL